MSTILKWAGNKAAIMAELKKHLPAGPRLVEPFAGSCAVMMATDYPHYLVADINPDLINLYQAIKNDVEYFIKEGRYLLKPVMIQRHIIRRDRSLTCAMVAQLNAHCISYI